MSERPTAAAALAAFLFSFACLLASTFLFSFINSLGVRMGNLSYLYSILLQGIAFALPALLYYRRHVEHRPALRLKRLDPLCAVLIVLAALAGMLALNWISIYWTLLLNALGLSTGTGNALTPRTPETLFLSLITTAFLPALCEELLFRGFLLPSLERLGRWPAVLITGALFALPHGSLEALPAHLLLGILLAWLVLLANNLTASMLFHGVYNAAVLVLAYRGMQANPAEASTLPTIAEAVDLLPTVVLMLGVFWLLFYAAMERGRNKATNPLPAPARESLTRREKIMLTISAVLLLALEVFTLAGMLPGASA